MFFDLFQAADGWAPSWPVIRPTAARGQCSKNSARPVIPRNRSSAPPWTANEDAVVDTIARRLRRAVLDIAERGSASWPPNQEFTLVEDGNMTPSIGLTQPKSVAVVDKGSARYV